MLHKIPEEFRKHAYDKAWLEEHGQKAMAEYIRMHEEDERGFAFGVFVKSMGLISVWPDWYKELDSKSEGEFEQALSEIYPDVAWPWEKGQKGDAPSFWEPETTIESRGGSDEDSDDE